MREFLKIYVKSLTVIIKFVGFVFLTLLALGLSSFAIYLLRQGNNWFVLYGIIAIAIDALLYAIVTANN